MAIIEYKGLKNTSHGFTRIKAVFKALLSFCFFIVLFLSFFTPCYCFSEQENSEQYQKLRYKMVDRQIAARGIRDEKILQAMKDVPRHCFVPERHSGSSYGDYPLPIGYGQTISQPFIVALMTQLLEPEENDVAFEVGTGSGYQAAVLSKIVKSVYTMEIVPPLGQAAKTRLMELGYRNVTVRVGDGYYGWDEYAPFDCIVVTAASDHIPPSLIKQLKNGGKMAIPVGHPFQVQHLVLVEKSERGEIKTKNVLPVRFVPFRRKWDEAGQRPGIQGLALLERESPRGRVSKGAHPQAIFLEAK